jgi:8-oxo-dGTP diphosphatase
MSWPPKCPLLAVDVVIFYPDNKIVVIERKNEPFGFALPGGFVDEGESLEAAAIREVREEVGLELFGLRQIGAYSDPARDPRRHVVSIAFVGYPVDPAIMPKAADDAKSYVLVDADEAEERLLFCFDHKEIVTQANISEYYEIHGFQGRLG